MKILVVFIDMVRANRLSLYNDKIKNRTPIDNKFQELGGTVYKNFFSEAPDTPRAMASFISGELPFKNKCNSKTKWPRYYLKSDHNIFDQLLEKKYEMTFFSNPNERKTGMFSENINKLDIHNNNYDLDEYLKKVRLKKDHFLFISLPDFHWAIDDYGANTYGEKKGYEIISKNIDIIFKNLNKDDLDHIFIFSDHGFKFNYESKKEPIFQILNSDRTNGILFHRQKNENRIKFSQKLCGISQFYSTIDDLLYNTKSNNSFLHSKSKDYIVVEDFLNFDQVLNDYPQIWSVISKKEIYIRTLENGYLLNRSNQILKTGIDKEKDKLIAKKSSFSKYLKQKQKIENYKEFILKQTTYMDGSLRKRTPKILKLLFYIKDLLFERR